MDTEEVREIEGTLSRIRKASRIIQLVLDLILVVVIVVVILFDVCFVVGALYPDQFPITILSSGITVFSATCGVAIIAAILKIVSTVFSEIYKGEPPFSMAQVKRLRWIAALLLIDAVIGSLFAADFSAAMQIDGAWVNLTSTANNGPSSLIHLNLGEIIAAIGVFATSLVFQYGVLLQRLSDETL